MINGNWTSESYGGFTFDIEIPMDPFIFQILAYVESQAWLKINKKNAYLFGSLRLDNLFFDLFRVSELFIGRWKNRQKIINWIGWAC